MGSCEGSLIDVLKGGRRGFVWGLFNIVWFGFFFLVDCLGKWFRWFVCSVFYIFIMYKFWMWI